MKEIDELLYLYNKDELTWFGALNKLKQLEDEGRIVLYAGTYSFEEALKRPFCDSTMFYFYTLPDKQGYHFFSNPFGKIAVIMKDDEIFLKSHRKAYSKSFLTNRFYGDFRSGEYFNRKKKR